MCSTPVFKITQNLGLLRLSMKASKVFLKQDFYWLPSHLDLLLSKSKTKCECLLVLLLEPNSRPKGERKNSGSGSVDHNH